ncbi:hypothetical protein [Akkermansia muciniphila]|uniref:hypothetical protein n=1 Tax=Akkermansia muciniphila TaxID=239935 RepID=UPI0011AFC93C|nr:hypothetical protein [Akkermansia muciniphila]
MEKYKHVLMAIIIGASAVSIADASNGYLSIEGEPRFSKDEGGRFTAIPRRKSDKSEIKPDRFKYAWSREGKRQSSFELEPKNKKTVTVTLRRNDNIDAAISCTLKCTATHSSGAQLSGSLPITMTNLPPES